MKIYEELYQRVIALWRLRTTAVECGNREKTVLALGRPDNMRAEKKPVEMKTRKVKVHANAMLLLEV